MKHSTLKVCQTSETMGVRNAIKAQVDEDRFFAYAGMLKNNSAVMAVAKDGCEDTVADYLRKNQEKLGIPVNLTNRGFRRMARELVISVKGA